jgi:hypothetical protein
MNSLKKFSMAATVVGLGAMSSFAEIKVGDNLSLSGFLDMSANGGIDSADGADATLGASFDQFELDFMWKFGDKVSARADINAHPGTTNTHLNATTGMAMDLEQGFVTATLGSLSISTGRFLSSSGFEAAEPTGLFQYSTSKTLVYGGYQNGANVAWSSPMIGLYAAVVTDLWNTPETELLNTPGFEGQISLTPAEGVTAKAAFLWQTYDETGANADENQGLLNVWGSYAKGPITAAAEYNMLLSWKPDPTVAAVNDESGHGWLAMANYKVNDIFAATLRYSGIVIGDGDPDQEVTVSPSVAIAANWLALAEYRFNIDSGIQQYAAETTFTF